MENRRFIIIFSKTAITKTCIYTVIRLRHVSYYYEQSAMSKSYYKFLYIQHKRVVQQNGQYILANILDKYNYEGKLKRWENKHQETQGD